jgi:quercetin dioxygenase-like cupin family protein
MEVRREKPKDYIFNENLAEHGTIPENGILSRTIQMDDRSKVVLFVFAPGQELSAHTAPMPASIFIVSGEGTLKLGSDTMEIKPGSYAYMPPKMEHAIKARTEVVMLLTMVKGVAPGAPA